MEEVFAFIQEKNQEFAQLPLFEFMQDNNLHPKQRLIFAPCITPLALGFGELCQYTFREEPSDDELQQIINRHTYEEYFHWKWLIEDIEKLGFDYSSNYASTVYFLWGEETKRNRAVCPLIERSIFKANPIQKLVALEVAEVTANVFFEVSKPIALQLQEITGEEYRYFGGCHMGKEESHEINTPEIRQFLNQIELTQEARQEAFDLAEEVFDVYTDAVDEYMEYAKLHHISQLIQVA